MECRVKESVTRVSWRKVVDLLLALKFHQVGGDIFVDRLIARVCSLVPSPRANGRLACGPRGAHLFEIPGAEPPSDSVGPLADLMGHVGRGSGRRAPERSVGSLVALLEHAGRAIRALNTRE